MTDFIKQCPKCGSGDVHFCNISIRPYCAECNHWGRVNFGSREDAIEEWNDVLRAAESTSFAFLADEPNLYEDQ